LTATRKERIKKVEKVMFKERKAGRGRTGTKVGKKEWAEPGKKSKRREGNRPGPNNGAKGTSMRYPADLYPPLNSAAFGRSKRHLISFIHMRKIHVRTVLARNFNRRVPKY
jgi:hypothetical protein